jgi:hypothetical protein
VQAIEFMAGSAIKERQETAQSRLAGDRLNPQDLCDRGVMPQVGNPRQFIGPAEHTSQQSHGNVRWMASIRAAGLMRQHLLELLARPALLQKSAPYGHPTVGAEPLIGETNPNGLRPGPSANLQNRLVSAVWEWLNVVFHFNTRFNPQHHQTSTASFRLRERAR